MPSCYNIESKIFWFYCIIIVRALATGFLHVLSPLNQLDFGACAYRMTSSPILPRPSKTLSLALDNCVEMRASAVHKNGNRSIFLRVQTLKAHAQRSPFRVSFRSILRLPQTSAALSAAYCIACGGGDSRHTLCSHIFLPSFLQCSHLPPFSDWLSDIVFYACLYVLNR